MHPPGHRHGVFLPRWAPDLSDGYGQAFFVFSPPALYFLGEVWHLLGCDVITALNLACVGLILVAGTSMFLLGRLYGGQPGGWLAAAAYLYAPYFQVDLYVRHAWAELCGLACYPLILYGFGRFAVHGRHTTACCLGRSGMRYCYGAIFRPPCCLLLSWSRSSPGRPGKPAPGWCWPVRRTVARAWAPIWLPALAELSSIASQQRVPSDGLIGKREASGSSAMLESADLRHMVAGATP